MNWALRPLSDRMATYALNDTRYLYPLSEICGQTSSERQVGMASGVCARLVQEWLEAEDTRSRQALAGEGQ